MKLHTKLDDETVLEIQKNVISSIHNLNAIIPANYSQYNLAHIIAPKASNFHTGFYALVTRYYQIANFVKKITHNDKVAKYIAYKYLLSNKNRIQSGFINRKEEVDIDCTKQSELKLVLNRGGTYNILFANMPQYLRALETYYKKSTLNNLLLLIPRCLEDHPILDKFDCRDIIYFDDFITSDIISRYEKAIDEFSNLFLTQVSFLQQNFKIGAYEFLPLINKGLKNVFTYLIPQSILLYLVIERIFKVININAIIGTRVRRIYDRAFHVCALNNKIKSYILLHATIGTDINDIHKMGHFNHLTGVFCWGEKQKRIIENDPFSNIKNLYITGSPLFSLLNKQQSKKPSYEKRIMYAGTMDDIKLIELLISVISSMKIQVKLFVKVHPGVSTLPYNKFTHLKNVELLPANDFIENYYDSIDLLVTTISQSCIQAIIEKIPCLFTLVYHKHLISKFNSIFDMDDNERKHFCAYTEEGFSKSINRILIDKKYKNCYIKQQNQYLSKWIYFPLQSSNPAIAIDSIIMNN